MARTPLVVLTTVGSEADARALVTALLADRLIACGTFLQSARSIYRWEGKVREEGEVVVLLKTEQSRWDALCAAVRARHPYAVPELLALPVTGGLGAYLDWLARAGARGSGSASRAGHRPPGGPAGRRGGLRRPGPAPAPAPPPPPP